MMYPDQKQTIWITGIALAVLTFMLFWGSCRAVRAESGATWTTSPYEASPSGSDLASTLDNQIRELKTTIREYVETEMCMSANDTDGCSASNNGRLREGACRVFADDAQPSAILAADFPPGSTSLDQGRIWVDTNDANQLYMYDASWEEIDGVPAADRTNWQAATDQVTEHLLAVKATTAVGDDVDTATDCTGLSAINWETEAFDDCPTSSCHDNSTNNERITTPTGATRVRLQAYIHVDADSSSNNHMPYCIRLNPGATRVACGTVQNQSSAEAQPAITIDTGPVAVTGGTTYFDIIPVSFGSTSCRHAADGLEDVQTDSYFTMEVIK